MSEEKKWREEMREKFMRMMGLDYDSEAGKGINKRMPFVEEIWPDFKTDPEYQDTQKALLSWRLRLGQKIKFEPDDSLPNNEFITLSTSFASTSSIYVSCGPLARTSLVDNPKMNAIQLEIKLKVDGQRLYYFGVTVMEADLADMIDISIILQILKHVHECEGRELTSSEIFILIKTMSMLTEHRYKKLQKGLFLINQSTGMMIKPEMEGILENPIFKMAYHQMTTTKTMTHVLLNQMS